MIAKEFERKIQESQEIKGVILVLAKIENPPKVIDPIAAAGYIREFFLGGRTPDIDIIYTGEAEEEEVLNQVRIIVQEFGLTHLKWDVKNQQKRGWGNSSREAIAKFIDTITAIGVDAKGRLVDPTGMGLRDLAAGIIRRIKSEERFAGAHVDAAIKYMRFMAIHGFAPTPETEDFIREQAQNWQNIPDERSNKILKKLRFLGLDQNETFKSLLIGYDWQNIFYGEPPS